MKIPPLSISSFLNKNVKLLKFTDRVATLLLDLLKTEPKKTKKNNNLWFSHYLLDNTTKIDKKKKKNEIKKKQIGKKVRWELPKIIFM